MRVRVVCHLCNVKQENTYRHKKTYSYSFFKVSKNMLVFTHHRLRLPSSLSDCSYGLPKKKKKNKQKKPIQLLGVDPSRLANPIALAFSVPAHLMTCWRLMSRTLQGQERYLLWPTTMTVNTHLWSSGWNLSSFFPPDSPRWMMVWKMESEVWYLNINFPDGHASPTGYLSPVLFFWGLIYSRHLHIAGLLFVKLVFI